MTDTGRQARVYDGCEWNPDANQAAVEGEPHTTTVPATWMVGSDGDWRLCDSCAALDVFKRYTVRKRIVTTHEPSSAPVAGVAEGTMP